MTIVCLIAVAIVEVVTAVDVNLEAKWNIITRGVAKGVIAGSGFWKAKARRARLRYAVSRFGVASF